MLNLPASPLRVTPTARYTGTTGTWRFRHELGSVQIWTRWSSILQTSANKFIMKYKSGFTDTEIQYFKAMLFAVTLEKNCVSSPLYVKYMEAYNNIMQKESENRNDKKSIQEAIMLLERKGYKVTERIL